MYRRLIEWSRHNPVARRAFEWIDPEKRRGIVRALGGARRDDTIQAALEGKIANLSDIETFVVAHATPLRAPLVLVSQVHRSGGTLLSQLFDGHPALAAHPHELKIGHPTPEDWPAVQPALGAEECFRMLFEPRTVRFLRKGYTKGERVTEGQAFFNVPRLQYLIFLKLFEADPPRDQRGIIDLFFTAYFRAWLNYQGNVDQKRWVTAFAPRFARDAQNVAAYFSCYPDGRLIQIVRDPRTWYPSAKNHDSNRKQDDPVPVLAGVWKVSAESMLENKRRYGDRVIVLTFENLVGRTEPTMRYLARELGVDYDPILTQPTFNGDKILANSSFAVESAGVNAAPLKRENLLTAEEREYIERHCVALYDAAVALDRVN